MKLPLAFFKKNKPTAKYYFGLFLKEEEGSVILMELSASGLNIIASEKFQFTDGWENISEDVDQALFKLETQAKKSTNQFILFVYSHFIDKNKQQIKAPYLAKIKMMLRELELKTLGFIDALEAAVDYLEKKEESPLTAILVELDITVLSVNIFKGGQKILSEVIPRTDNFIDDLLQIFNTQKGHTLLPSRLILYNSKDLDEISTKILTYHWSEELFIQLPKVEIIKEDELIHGLVFIFHEQLKSSAPIVEEEQKEILGFRIGEDVAPKNNQKLVDPPIKTIKKIPLPKIHLGFVKNWLNTIMKLKLPFVIPVLLITTVILILFVVAEYFFHKAKLQIYFPSQAISKDITLEESIDGGLIKSTTDTKEIEESIDATGKKTVGEKARGEVTIFSFNEKENRFNKGTALSVEGVKFILDSDVVVASSSETLIDGKPVKKSGEGKVKVTASEIGTEGNISKGKRLQVADLSTSSYFAMSDSSFTGGTKSEITTVSKKDFDSLRSKLFNKAKSTTSEKENKNLEEKKLFTSLTEVKLEEENFSKEVGEEAKSLRLKAKAKITYYFYEDSALREKIFSLLKDEVKKGYQLSAENVDYEITKTEKDEKQVQLSLKIDSKALKEISKDELAKSLVFKNNQKLQELLKNKYQSEDYDLNVQTPLPFLKSWTPIFKKNITIEISTLN